MFDKTISFIACKEYIEFTEIKPEPAKLNIPKWYKDLDHHVEIRTIKGCMPFLDTLTTGYILKLQQTIIFVIMLCKMVKDL